MTHCKKEVRIYKLWIENNSLSALGSVIMKHYQDRTWWCIHNIIAITWHSYLFSGCGIFQAIDDWGVQVLEQVNHKDISSSSVIIVFNRWWYKIHSRKIYKPACWEEHNMWQEPVTLSQQTTEMSCRSSLKFVVPICSNVNALFFL